ncbi:MAG: glycosyltransferase family 2 protein [Lachnospiraceae bacterium]|jgi:glycosyltransferase involved in cell wall biosynthesis|nr:glycosyltransferase family 2 protein [Lachnospiraceae bacterium]
MQDKILVMIPAYNEYLNLPQVISELQEKCPGYDYVIVNDGSTDSTRKLCNSRHYNVLDLPVNLGLAGAVRAGMKYANYYGYDYAVQIDGDGQHCPEYIAEMIARMKETGSDIVIGSRFKTQKKPFTMRMLGSHMISGALWLTTGGKRISDVTSGMRLFSKKMIRRFDYGMNYRPEPDTLAYLLNHGVKIEEVQVSMRERISGRSYLGFFSSIGYMVHVLFNIFVVQWFREG